MILMAPHCAFCPTMTSMATSFTTHTTQQICAAVVRPMSVMGQERRSDGMSALLPKADLTERDRHVPRRMDASACYPLATPPDFGVAA